MARTIHEVGDTTVLEKALTLLNQVHRLNMFPVYFVPVGSRVAVCAENDEVLLDRIYDAIEKSMGSEIRVSLDDPMA